MLVIAVVAQLFCGTASVTSASRMLFAFSRDGASPVHRSGAGSRSGARPSIAVWRSACSPGRYAADALERAVGYLVGTSIAVIGLYIAFVLPIILRWRAGDASSRGVVARQALPWIDPLAIGWIALICILFLLPTVPHGHSGQRTASAGTSSTTRRSPSAGRSALRRLVGLSAKHWFKGPIRQGDEDELERIEAQYQRRQLRSRFGRLGCGRTDSPTALSPPATEAVARSHRRSDPKEAT